MLITPNNKKEYSMIKSLTLKMMIYSFVAIVPIAAKAQDTDALLQRKYDILEKQADAAQKHAEAIQSAADAKQNSATRSPTPATNNFSNYKMRSPLTVGDALEGSGAQDCIQANGSGIRVTGGLRPAANTACSTRPPR